VASEKTLRETETKKKAPAPEENPVPSPPPKEHGGRQGVDPTRYDDWEKGGRCIDF
jgi:hypothetical protein